MTVWTVEEMNLISGYWKEGMQKEELKEKMNNALPYMEKEIRQLVNATIKKLDVTPDREYGLMKFIHSGVRV